MLVLRMTGTSSALSTHVCSLVPTFFPVPAAEKTTFSDDQDLSCFGAGALKKAAENARKDGKSVGCSIVETFSKDAQPQELSDVLRLEYRSKLLNPKWAKVNIMSTMCKCYPSHVSIRYQHLD